MTRVQPDLSVGRGVIRDTIRLAALEVPGVLRLGRGGPAWRGWLSGPPISVRVRNDLVHVKVWVVARPATVLPTLGGEVRLTIRAAVERLLGLEVGSISVLVDGVGT